MFLLQFNLKLNYCSYIKIKCSESTIYAHKHKTLLNLDFGAIIFPLHHFGSLVMLERSKNTISLTEGYFKGLFSWIFFIILERTVMQSLLNFRTESSPTLLLGLLCRAYQRGTAYCTAFAIWVINTVSYNFLCNE